MGEHLICIQKVVGSIPSTSTKSGRSLMVRHNLAKIDNVCSNHTVRSNDEVPERSRGQTANLHCVGSSPTLISILRSNHKLTGIRRLLIIECFSNVSPASFKYADAALCRREVHRHPTWNFLT